MRGKKCKKLLSWLLCACLMMGVLPVSAFAADTEQQSESTLAGQEDDVNELAAGEEGQTEDAGQLEEATQQETTKTQESKEQTTDGQEAAIQNESSEEEKTEPRTADGSAVIEVKLVDTDGSVWGKGIITGSGDLDDKSWDEATDENRGYDDSSSNAIIRSFDTINYNVTTTIRMTPGTSHTLVYEVTLPDDDELTLDESKMNAIRPIECRKNGDGTKTYICMYTLPESYAGGEKEENVVLKVGNKHQGDVITPVIKAYLDTDTDAALTVKNMESVTVTTAPMYNIVLKKLNNEKINKDIYDFNQANATGKTYYPDNAKDYTDSKVTGYKCTYGFALEMRKPGDGIKGVEFPDPSKDFTFDIDLSSVTLNGQNLAENGFLPLLYYLGPNEAGGAGIAEIPFTKDYESNADLKGMGCYNSGNVSMTQEGTTLHVSVKDFQIDTTKFPKENYAGTSYWEDLNKIREGIFSSFQFQVVYPYINEKGENLQEKLGNGTVNVGATVTNMNAVSETGARTTEETSLSDNTQTNTWSLNAGNKRNQQIFYSDRNNIIGPYTIGKIWNDGDIAPVGANDLAFTVSYTESNVGEADVKNNLPVAIDQFVLFDRSAIEDVEYSNYIQQSTNVKQYGYECHVLYAVRKDGRMDNESMRTANLDEFEFYDTKPEGGCDGVMVQYRGMNLGNSDLALHAQFTAKVKADTEIADKVYMITAFTNTWTVDDYQEEILADTEKTSVSELTRKDFSDWGKKQTSIGFVKDGNSTKLTADKTPTQQAIDNRGYYTVPRYEEGAYIADPDHKGNINTADGLYIVPYTTTVTKTVAQTDDDGKVLERYNIGKNQRYVDYKISSSIKYWADIEPVEGSKTTIYLEDTVPEGLSYIPNSAYWGGEYICKYPQAGKVDGGQQIEPTITINNGKTVLKWTIPNVTLKNGELPTLYYSCKISNSVADNANLENEVIIQTTEDKRPAHKEYDNISTAGISVTRDKEFYIVKRGGDSLELQDTSYYELVASNTSSEDKKDLCVFDTMPYAGDGKSRQFNGQYKITALTMDATEVNHASDMEIWYTDNAKYIGKTADDIEPSEVTEANGWKKADASGYEGDTITFTGEGLIGAWPTVIAYKDANLEKNTIATLRLEYEAAAGAEKDNFTNTWSTMSNGKEIDSSVDTDVYNRTIEGTVWYDKNKDGKIDGDEKKLENVKVTLLVKDENGNYVPYEAYDQTVDGTTVKSPSTVLTDKDGHYKFTALPSGEYRVKFESSDGTDLGYYDVTEPNADKDVTKTSKVEKDNAEKDENGELVSGTITDIGMPSLDKMVSEKKTTHNLPDQNLGLIIPEKEIPVTKVWNDANNQDGKRPDKVEITLLADGIKTDEKLELTAANNWTGKFENLPKYDEKDMHVIAYTIEETEVEDYNTPVITGDVATGYTVTNTHTPETTEVSGSKTWDDADNQDGDRPESITIRLLANGKEAATKEVRADDNWSWTFTDLPKYENGVEIIYTITEDSVKDYTTTVDGYNVTNTHKPGKVSVPVTKAWNDGNNQDGIRPEAIKVHLYADGKDTGKELELTKENNWSGVFTDLDEKAAGKKIEYTIKEDKVDGYTSEITGDAKTGYIVTNTHTPSTPDKPNTPDNPGTPDKPNTPGNPGTTDTTNTSNSKTEPVKTGDSSDVMNWMFLCMAGLGMAIAAYRRRDSK